MCYRGGTNQSWLVKLDAKCNWVWGGHWLTIGTPDFGSSHSAPVAPDRQGCYFGCESSCLAGLIVLMAQMGCYVPADVAVIPVRDRILSRIGTGDDMENNVSTFLMEMRDVAQVRLPISVVRDIPLPLGCVSEHGLVPILLVTSSSWAFVAGSAPCSESSSNHNLSDSFVYLHSDSS